MISCRSCAFAVIEQDVNGFCRRRPPQAVIQPSGAISGTFPPVHLDNFWCGEHAPAKKRPAKPA